MLQNSAMAGVTHNVADRLLQPVEITHQYGLAGRLKLVPGSEATTMRL